MFKAFLKANPKIQVALQWLLKIFAVGGALNELRGAVMAAPVLYGMTQTGEIGVWFAGACVLGGIAMSVIIPMFAYKKLSKLIEVDK